MSHTVIIDNNIDENDKDNVSVTDINSDTEIDNISCSECITIDISFIYIKLSLKCVELVKDRFPPHVIKYIIFLSSLREMNLYICSSYNGNVTSWTRIFSSCFRDK